MNRIKLTVDAAYDAAIQAAERAVNSRLGDIMACPARGRADASGYSPPSRRLDNLFNKLDKQVCEDVSSAFLNNVHWSETDLEGANELVRYVLQHIIFGYNIAVQDMKYGRVSSFSPDVSRHHWSLQNLELHIQEKHPDLDTDGCIGRFRGELHLLTAEIDAWCDEDIRRADAQCTQYDDEPYGGIVGRLLEHYGVHIAPEEMIDNLAIKGLYDALSAAAARYLEDLTVLQRIKRTPVQECTWILSRIVHGAAVGDPVSCLGTDIISFSHSFPSGARDVALIIHKYVHEAHESS